MKSKKTLSIIAVCLVSAVAITYAAFSTTFDVGNKFKMNDATAEFVEEFNAPKEGEIVAGKSYDKSGQVFNKGTVPVKARAKISISWLDANNIEITSNKPNGTLEQNKNAYTLNFGDTVTETDAQAFQSALAQTDNFDVIANGSGDDLWKYDTDGFFYYKGKTGIIEKNQSSIKLLNSITFSSLLADVTESKKYYLATDNTFSKPYATQEDAVKEANGAAIKYRSITEMKYPNYKDLTLVVTIQGEIIEADGTWS